MKNLRHNEKLKPHPMDEIPVRNLRFKFDSSGTRITYYDQTDI